MEAKKSRIQVKKMIESDSKNVLDYLESILDESRNKEILELIIIQRGNLSEIRKRQSQGTIAYEEYSRILSNINVNIFDIIDELPDDFFQSTTVEKDQKTEASTNGDYIYIANLIRELIELNIKESESINPAVHGHLNEKRHVIVNQIIRIVEDNQFFISSREYKVIAEAFHRSVGNVSAEEYYKKAITTIDPYTDSANSKIIAIRSYADFLYRINRPADGANQYAATLLEKDTDEANLSNGATYQMKFYNEVDIGNFPVAIEAYEKAKYYYSKVGNAMIRNHNIKNLESVWNSKQIPASYSRP